MLHPSAVVWSQLRGIEGGEDTKGRRERMHERERERGSEGAREQKGKNRQRFRNQASWASGISAGMVIPNPKHLNPKPETLSRYFIEGIEGEAVN